MKHKIFTENYVVKFASLFSVVFLLMAHGSLQAADLEITLTEAACQVSLSTPGGDGCDTNQCNGEAGCVCAAKGDFITWSLAGGDKFKMNFSGDSPLKDNCGKNYSADKEKCKVKDDVVAGQNYDYEVQLEKCEQATDPKIIIK